MANIFASFLIAITQKSSSQHRVEYHWSAGSLDNEPPTWECQSSTTINFISCCCCCYYCSIHRLTDDGCEQRVQCKLAFNCTLEYPSLVLVQWYWKEKKKQPLETLSKSIISSNRSSSSSSGNKQNDKTAKSLSSWNERGKEKVIGNT